VALLLAHLAAAIPSAEFGNSADLDTALAQQPARDRAAYLVASERGAEPGGASGGTLVQQVDVAVSLVVFCRNFRDQRAGSGARAAMDAFLAEIRAALINWSPDALVYRPLSLQASNDRRFNAGTLVVQEIYRTRYRIQVNA
jgi:hypothetical protein